MGKCFLVINYLQWIISKHNEIRYRLPSIENATPGGWPTAFPMPSDSKRLHGIFYKLLMPLQRKHRRMCPTLGEAPAGRFLG